MTTLESPVELNEKVYYRKDKPEEDIAFQKRVLKIFYGKQGTINLSLYVMNLIERWTKTT